MPIGGAVRKRAAPTSFWALTWGQAPNPAAIADGLASQARLFIDQTGWIWEGGFNKLGDGPSHSPLLESMCRKEKGRRDERAATRRV